MTEIHQNYIGAHQHISTADEKEPLPYGIKPIPHLFQGAGYFNALMSRKTHCNFLPDERAELFMGENRPEREPGQPFFARMSFGGTHRMFHRDPERPIDIKDVELPAYYADTPLNRRG